tara:strand:- start:2779 stop:3507 length:729 start_codon:yes stop_codon:yes gene_type:complete
MKLKLLSIIIFILCISLFLSLGFWQLDRAEEKDSIISLYQSRQQTDIEKLPNIKNKNIKELYYRNYRLKGRYINNVFLIDNKIKNKTPGFNVISPFKLKISGEVILVDRGWIPMKGTRQDIAKNFNYLNNLEITKNVQEIDGYIYPREKSYTIGEIFTDNSWPRLIQAVNFKEIAASLDLENVIINGVIFRLGKNNSFGFDREWKIIHMSSSKHLGYAFQWFSMAAALIILIFIYYVRKKDG